MNHFKLKLFLICMFVAGYSIPFYAQIKEELRPGDEAPKLEATWLKGAAITNFEKGQIYAINFTGTWCPPCMKFLPELTEIARKYSGKVEVISLFFEDQIERVKKYMDAMGAKWGFAVAIDDQQSYCNDNWLKKVSDAGPSTTFIVDKNGRIAWIGNTKDIEAILEQIVGGSDISSIATQIKENNEEIGKVILRAFALKKSGQFQKANWSIDSLIESLPPDSWRLNVLYMNKFNLLAGSDDVKAYEWLEWLLGNKVRNFDWQHLLETFSSNIIRPENRNYEIELKAIDRAINEAEVSTNAVIPLDLKASIYADMGNYPEAIKACKYAMELSDADYKPVESDRLIFYRYKYKSSKNEKKADKWLSKQELAAGGSAYLSVLLIQAVTETKKPDFDLALSISDKALNRVERIYDKQYLLTVKGDLYYNKKDFKSAINCYEKALDIAKVSEGWNGSHIKKYEEKIKQLENLLWTKSKHN